ncbi:unnamed protein product [Ciceribacter selenitireducens ATCC BAA-1503]|uniref:Uncharacterized protein n=1 Tax=Ciceribacter selenitireducens ATCC BAA-1503 TaxID=1336235 RepID=A0A376ABS9_9HYPH|nr:unnamed protein product [Ciceribacter selenitireducens ATCC BAA-1503]
MQNCCLHSRASSLGTLSFRLFHCSCRANCPVGEDNIMNSVACSFTASRSGQRMMFRPSTGVGADLFKS